MIGDYKDLIKLKHPHRANAFKVCESEMLSKISMINFDDYANENETAQELCSNNQT